MEAERVSKQQGKVGGNGGGREEEEEGIAHF